MSNETKQIIVTRFKALLWSVGNYSALLLLAFIANNIGLVDMPVWAAGAISLLTAQITKYLNTGR